MKIGASELTHGDWDALAEVANIEVQRAERQAADHAL